jgi:hypothetical protein
MHCFVNSVRVTLFGEKGSSSGFGEFFIGPIERIGQSTFSSALEIW